MHRAILALLALAPLAAYSQDRLQHMPRYDRYEKLRREIGGSVTRGDLNASWASDSKSFTFQKAGKTVQFDLATKTEKEPTPGSDVAPNRGRQNGGRRNPERGRQFDTAF